MSDGLFLLVLDLVYNSAVISNVGQESFANKFYRVWYDLYGVLDMREIWFNKKFNPTVVEVVFQVKEISDVDLSTETLHLNAVLDIEWMDPRLSWSVGFLIRSLLSPI